MNLYVRDSIEIITIKINKLDKKSMGKLPIIILSSLIIIGFSIPIVVTILFIHEIEITILISYAIFWGSTFYLFKLLLWNLFGTEVFEIKSNKILYYNDYKYFKLGVKDFTYSKLKISFIDESTNEYELPIENISNDKELFFTLEIDDSELIISHFAVPKQTLESYLHVFSRYLPK